MPCLGAMIDEHRDDLMALAAGMYGAPVSAMTPAGQGGNNRIYRVEAGSDILALKAYPPNETSIASGASARLDAEFTALRFLNDAGIRCVPIPHARASDGYHGMYQWIDGNPIGNPDDQDIDAASDFAQCLKTLSTDPAASSLGLAREACLSASELLRQVEARHERLSRVAANHQELARFLNEFIAPAFTAAHKQMVQGYLDADLNVDDDIEPGLRTLSPSDFGFHNAIRHVDGSLVFIDFEYFGWDDPVRLVADFVLHPGMNLGQEHGARFMRRALAIYNDDENFALRLGLLYPLVVLRWCLILLNEFLPEKWENRTFAGTSHTVEAVQEGQLEKASTMLARIHEPPMSFKHAP
jgi:hypothetical protein